MNHNSDSNSPLDDFMKSLGLDTHQPNNIEHTHNNLHDSSQLHNLNQSATSDIIHNNWADNLHNFNQQHHQSDWTHSHETHPTDNQWQNPETGFPTGISATPSDGTDNSQPCRNRICISHKSSQQPHKSSAPHRQFLLF